MVENLELNDKTLAITWKKPFDLVAKRPFPKNSRAAGIQTQFTWPPAMHNNHYTTARLRSPKRAMTGEARARGGENNYIIAKN